MKILNAIETNYIITQGKINDDYGFYRVRIKLSGLYNTYFELEQINLNELCS